MFRILFGFEGRLGRLAFFGWTLVGALIVFATALIWLVIGAVCAILLPSGTEAPRAMGIAMGASALIVGTWTTLALQAKRLRDLGLKPMLWIVGAWAAMLADYLLLAPLTDVRFFPPFDRQTPLGGLVGLAYMIALFFWPSRQEAQPPVLPASRLNWN